MSVSSISKLRDFFDYVMLKENGIVDDFMIEIFNKLPGRTDLPEYYLAISKPMSFQKILRSMKQYDGDVQAVIQDFCQISYNCRYYNEQGTTFYESAVKLDNAIKEKLVPKAREVFNDPSLHWVDLGTVPGEPDHKEPEKKEQLEMTKELKKEEENTEKQQQQEQNKVEDEKKTEEVSTYKNKEPENTKSNDQQTPTADVQSNENNTILTTSKEPEITEYSTENNIVDSSTLQGVDNGNGIFTATDGREYITSPDVARNFTKVPVGSRERYPEYVAERILKYEGRKFSGLSEHQTRKKGRPTIRPILENKYMQFLNVEKIMENSLLDHKAPFVYDGEVRTFEQIKFNIKRGFILTAEEMMLGLKQVCEYQVTNAFKQNREAVKRFTDKVLDRAYAFFSDYRVLKEDGDKITIDRVEYNGIVYEIGSYVLLKNTVDESRPIPAQIFQIWRESSDDSLWMSCSWYLRPEQTVHRADRLFYKNEVVKCMQSRIHRIEDILGLCSVIHMTRYVRAEPLDLVQPMFICEYRYNDSSYRFNKIRTWKGAVPDAVKDLEEYDVPLPQPRFLKKFESPLKHLLDPTLPLNSPRAPESLPTLQNTKDSEQPSLGNIYRDCILEKDDLGEYSTSLKYTQRHLILPQHFHLIPSNIRFDPVSESFIDSGNVLNKMVLTIYGSGLQNFNAPSLEQLARAGITKSLPPAHNPSGRLATLNSYGNNQQATTAISGNSSLIKSGNGINKDGSLGPNSLNNLQSRSAMTKVLLNAAEKKKAKYNKSLNLKSGNSSFPSSQQNNKATTSQVKTDTVSTKSHYLDVLLSKNRLSKSKPSFLADEKTIDNDHRYALGEPQAFVLNEPLLEHIEGYRRTTPEINSKIVEDVERYNSTIADKNNHVILYNNTNLKNESEKKLQEIKIAELKKKEEEDALAALQEDEVLDSDDEIDNLYLSKNQRKRKNSDLSSDGSFIDSELSETEIIERKAYKKLQKLDKKEQEQEEEELMKKYCKMVDGVKKGDIIWFKGMGTDIVNRIIDPKKPLDVASVGPSLEYLQYRMNKDKINK